MNCACIEIRPCEDTAKSCTPASQERGLRRQPWSWAYPEGTTTVSFKPHCLRYAREAIAHVTVCVLLKDRDGTLPQCFAVLHGTVLQRRLGWRFTSQLLVNSKPFSLYLQNPNSKDVNHKKQKQILFCFLELGLVWWPLLTELKNQRCLYATSK